MTGIIDQINYIGAAALFAIGLYMVLTNTNLVKKIIGINIMETAVFLIFVTIGFVRGGRAPVVSATDAEGVGPYVNPLPAALILTGIVVAVSITVYALSMVIRIYQAYGTIETDEIQRIREQSRDD